MIEIEYIPMKTPEGQTAGHARVQGGFVDIRLKQDRGGQAFVFTDSGHTDGDPKGRIRASGRVAAVAVHAGGALSCVGFAHTGTMTLADVRRRVLALTEKPAPPVRTEAAPAPVSPPPVCAGTAPVSVSPPPVCAETAPDPIPPQPSPKTEAAPAPQRAADHTNEAEVIPLRRSARHVPAGNDVKLALDRLAQPDDAAFFPTDAQEKPGAPRILPAIPDDGDDERAAAFSALLARADAIFRRISEPFDGDDDPPLSFHAQESAAKPNPPADLTRAPEPSPASRDLGAWSRAVDDILADMPAAVPRAIENPFPHIFPEARFVHRGDLMGDETLAGEWHRSGEHFKITAVRGDYSPQPPERLAGFTRYIRTLRGGYWIKVEENSRFPSAERL